jgi:two-component system, OmpR family, sensor kinase
MPIRVRLTLAAVGSLVVVVTALSWFVYARMGRDLLETVDAGLRSRSEVFTSELRARGPSLPHMRATLIETDEDFAQVADRSGALLDSSAIVAGTSLVPAGQLATVDQPTFFDVHVPAIDNVTRVIVVPVDVRGTRYLLSVGASLQDRRDEMLLLAATLSVAGLFLVALLGAGAWWLIGAALDPVERMRRQAEAISGTDPGARLTIPDHEDELSRLGGTLNAMLGRVEGAARHERELIDLASHELRTPLAVQRVGLDLALSGPQTPEELRDGLEEASAENEHLARIADHLLVLARAREGRLAIRRRELSLNTLLEDAVKRHRPTADNASIDLAADGPDASVQLDPDWMRQALDDLLDNAIKATPQGGHVHLRGDARDGHVDIVVQDTGTGFGPDIVGDAFEPFRSGDGSGGAGLGLSTVRAITEAHGGTVTAQNTRHGARITLSMPRTG